jgi:hypothetical protein
MTDIVNIVQTYFPGVDLDSLSFTDILKVCYRNISKELNADLFLYSAEISDSAVDELIQIIRNKNIKRKNAVLILTTYGGSPHAAYRLTRIFQRCYEKFTLFLFGYCKSAGTLIAIGADEIVMSDFAELGPLDIQILKNDDLIGRSSGLDLQQSLKQLNIHVFEVFIDCFVQTLATGAGAITTKTAADIASSVAVGLLSPIAAQIDPLRIGEVSRSVKIAEDYGKRLNSNREKAIKALISQYSSHNFVIDSLEAQELFGEVVRHPKNLEILLERILYEKVRCPDNSDPWIWDLSKLDVPDESNSSNESTNTDNENYAVANDTSNSQNQNNHGNIELREEIKKNDSDEGKISKTARGTNHKGSSTDSQ